MSTKRTRQKYTKEFIRDAVQLVTEQGYGCNGAARRLGVNQGNRIKTYVILKNYVRLILV